MVARCGGARLALAGAAAAVGVVVGGGAVLLSFFAAALGAFFVVVLAAFLAGGFFAVAAAGSSFALPSAALGGRPRFFLGGSAASPLPVAAMAMATSLEGEDVEEDIICGVLCEGVSHNTTLFHGNPSTSRTYKGRGRHHRQLTAAAATTATAAAGARLGHKGGKASRRRDAGKAAAPAAAREAREDKGQLEGEAGQGRVHRPYLPLSHCRLHRHYLQLWMDGRA